MPGIAVDLGISAKSMGKVRKAGESADALDEGERAALKHLHKRRATSRLNGKCSQKRRLSSPRKIDEVRTHRRGESFVPVASAMLNT